MEGRTYCVAALVVFLLPAVAQAGSRPNVLFLVVDDLRPKLGCYGETNMVTPNIDQLAAKSVQFDRAYVQQALCSPSRTSFLTGRRPDTTRTYDLNVYFRHLAGNYTTLPQHFKDNGYITQSVGKVFHRGPTSGNTDDYPYSWTFPAWHPPTQKFWLDPVCPGPGGKFANNAVCPLTRNQMPMGALPDEQSTDFAISFLQNRSRDGKEFFLAVGLHKPHLAFRYPAEYKDLYPLSKIKLADNPYPPLMMPDVAYSPWSFLRSFDDIKALNISWPFGAVPMYYQYLLRQSYSAAVSYLDAQVGRLLHEVDRLRLANNTIISFHGDHGWLLGEHQEWTKHTNFDMAVRIPVLFYIPGITSEKSSSGQTFPFHDALAASVEKRTVTGPKKWGRPLRTEAMVEAVDLYATLADLSGLPVPPTCPPDPFSVTFCTEGSSFASVIRNVSQALLLNKYNHAPTATKWKPAVFSQYPRPTLEPSKETIAPPLKHIRIMGYSMLTVNNMRYTEWVAYNHTTFTANWSHVYARELYDFNKDSEGNINVVHLPTYNQTVVRLAKQLRYGWRKALPNIYT